MNNSKILQDNDLEKHVDVYEQIRAILSIGRRAVKAARTRMTLLTFLIFLPLVFLAVQATAREKAANIADEISQLPKAHTVKQAAEKTVEIRRQSQKLTVAWAREEAELLSQINALEKDLEALKWRRKKTAAYLEDLEKKMTALNAKNQADREIRNELEPFLDERLEALKQFAQGDLPLLKEMQAPHLQLVKQTLNDADATMVQKSRSLLESVMQAVEYGYFVETDEAEITIDGKSVRVQRINVGRLGLFTLSTDGHDAWKWNRDRDQYEPAPHFTGDIKEAIQIAERARLVTLVELPVGPPSTLDEETAK